MRNVRSWGCGGAPLALPVARRFIEQGIRVRTGMRMTETGPTVFLLDEADVLDKRRDKALVNLTTACTGRDGRLICDGEALTLFQH
ncbi:hypothetical protein NA637_07850 [Pseudomonas stutzeri]|nr:hypothetical protein [Stutzerimonas stutzeri]MCQ4320110.1 hypothetical protein [Stutzerimonas stutzeri]